MYQFNISIDLQINNEEDKDMYTKIIVLFIQDLLQNRTKEEVMSMLNSQELFEVVEYDKEEDNTNVIDINSKKHLN